MTYRGPRQKSTETEIYTLDKDGYFKRGRSERAYPGSHGRLHRILWIEAYGAIPKGFSVHHKDHDRQNNTLENLELVAHGEHARRHRKTQVPWSRVCLECKSPFQSRAHNSMFCCSQCQQRYRWNALRGRRN